MCIPCVMCGACMELDQSADRPQHETVCPDCGRPVAEDDICCPSCHTLLPLNVLSRRKTQRATPTAEPAEFRGLNNRSLLR